MENAAQIPELSTLVAVLTSPGYEPILNALNSPGSYTVFAPNNEAFAAINPDVSQVDFISQVLYYHVIPATVYSKDLAPLQFPASLMSDADYVTLGGAAQRSGVAANSAGVTVNWGIPGVLNETSTVVTADIACSNGVIHIVDAVMLFPKLTSDVATEAGLTDLVDAVVATDLVSVVNDTPTVTIFAPTNAAFEAIADIVATLSPAQLTAVLAYHVVPVNAYSTDLVNGMKVPTLNGEQLTIFTDAGVVVEGSTNKATVILPNALTQNGVVHVVDTVLIPSNL